MLSLNQKVSSVSLGVSDQEVRLGHTKGCIRILHYTLFIMKLILPKNTNLTLKWLHHLKFIKKMLPKSFEKIFEKFLVEFQMA